MKSLFVPTLATLFTILACNVAFGQGRVAVAEPIVRGRVVLVNPQTRTMSVSIESSSTPIAFYGMEGARVETVSGRAATLADLLPGTTIAVQYATRERRWYPQRIVIPDANIVVPHPATPLSPAESRAIDSAAANDGDITTNPGVKARIDDDITTKPGEKDPAEHDITKRRAR